VRLWAFFVPGADSDAGYRNAVNRRVISWLASAGAAVPSSIQESSNEEAKKTAIRGIQTPVSTTPGNGWRCKTTPERLWCGRHVGSRSVQRVSMRMPPTGLSQHGNQRHSCCGFPDSQTDGDVWFNHRCCRIGRADDRFESANWVLARSMYGLLQPRMLPKKQTEPLAAAMSSWCV